MTSTKKSLRKAKKESKKDGVYLFNTHDVTRLLRDTSKYTFDGNNHNPKKFPHLKWAVSKAQNIDTLVYSD